VICDVLNLGPLVAVGQDDGVALASEPADLCLKGRNVAGSAGGSTGIAIAAEARASR